jgi:CRISPR/Cas system-associated exonuclease Cas4 (RecB family)
MYIDSMGKATYSSSRLEQFHSCSLKYWLGYKQSLYAEDTQQNVFTRRGNAFHKFAETYQPSWDDTKIKEMTEAAEKQFRVPEEFTIKKPVTRFLTFYRNVITPILEAGGKLHQEVQFNFSIDDHKLTGKLDVLLECADGTFQIIDYKTGKTAQTSYYVNQMMIYAWAIHKQYGVPIEEVPTRVKIGLFFPVANEDKEDVMKVFKKVSFKEDSLQKTKDHVTKTIELIEGDWTPIPTLSKLCEFCSFCGLKQYCKASVDAGYLPTRGIVIKKRDWSTYNKR